MDARARTCTRVSVTLPLCVRHFWIVASDAVLFGQPPHLGVLTCHPCQSVSEIKTPPVHLGDAPECVRQAQCALYLTRLFQRRIMRTRYDMTGLRLLGFFFFFYSGRSRYCSHELRMARPRCENKHCETADKMTFDLESHSIHFLVEHF